MSGSVQDQELKQYQARIERIAPGLSIREIQVNSDGLANEVVIVNRELVFRFAKGEYGRKSLARELQVLDALQGNVDLQIPDPFYTSPDAIAYRFLPGEPLTRSRLSGLTNREQQAVADQLAGFLQTMHGINQTGLPSTIAPVGIDHFRNQYQKVVERIYPLLLPHQVDWVEEVFAFLDQPGAFDFKPGLIHGDLASYHLLFDPEEKRLSGVLDFGVSGIGDPASDMLLQNYGLGFVRRLELCYPRVVEYLPRARFYAQEIELQWVLLGLETGENFWFTAHLGGARDL